MEKENQEMVNNEVEMVVGTNIVLYKDAEKSLSEECRDRIKETYPELIETVLEAGECYSNDILGKEISKDVCKSAHKLKVRLEKAVKASNSDRLKTNRIRKEAIDNDNEDFKALKEIIEPIISALDNTANHYKRLEEKIISDRRIERLNLLLSVDPEIEEPAGLKTWSDEDFNIYLSGKKIQVEKAKEQARKEAEELERENELIALKESRILECSDYSDFIPNFKELDFKNMEQSEYDILFSNAKNECISLAYKEAQKEYKEREKESLLIKKADGFVLKLLESGFEKRQRGDYIKDRYTVSFETLKTLSIREFTDRLKEIDDAIYSAMWDDAHNQNRRIDEEIKRRALLAPDKNKMLTAFKEIDDFLVSINPEFKSEEYAQALISLKESLHVAIESERAKYL